jgi:hypothetical protein
LTVDLPTVNGVFSGLVLLLGAVATLVTARSRRMGVQRREFRELQRTVVDAFGHIFVLETALAQRGITPPPRPKRLDEVGEDDVPTPTALPPQPSPEPQGPPRAAN